MNNWIGVTLSIAVLGGPANIYAAQIPPVPDNPMRAQTFFGVNIKTRCPDLRAADAGSRTVVIFWVPRRGTQSLISIKTSSGSNELDSAAISCVSKLRFAPSTSLGDGEPVDSWQQFALSWADQDTAGEARAASPQSASVPRPSQSTATAPAQIPANARQDRAGGQGKSAVVHVCVDEKGKLEQEPAIVQSSGVATLDQAAVKIAAAGSPYYRPLTSSKGLSVSGCAKVAIEFDTK